MNTFNDREIIYAVKGKDTFLVASKDTPSGYGVYTPEYKEWIPLPVKVQRVPLSEEIQESDPLIYTWRSNNGFAAIDPFVDDVVEAASEEELAVACTTKRMELLRQSIEGSLKANKDPIHNLLGSLDTFQAERFKLRAEYQKVTASYLEASKLVRSLAAAARSIPPTNEAGAARTLRRETDLLDRVAESVTQDLWADVKRPILGGRTMFSHMAEQQGSRRAEASNEEEKGDDPEIPKNTSIAELADQLREISSNARIVLEKIAKLEQSSKANGSPAAKWGAAVEAAKQYKPTIAGTFTNWSFSKVPSGIMCGQIEGRTVFSGRVTGLGFDAKSGLPCVTDEKGSIFLLSENYGGAWNPLEEMDWIKKGIAHNMAEIGRGIAAKPNAYPYEIAARTDEARPKKMSYAESHQSLGSDEESITP